MVNPCTLCDPTNFILERMSGSKGRECEAAGRGCNGLEGGGSVMSSRGGVDTHLRLYITFLIQNGSLKSIHKLFLKLYFSSDAGRVS